MKSSCRSRPDRPRLSFARPTTSDPTTGSEQTQEPTCATTRLGMASRRSILGSSPVFAPIRGGRKAGRLSSLGRNAQGYGGHFRVSREGSRQEGLEVGVGDPAARRCRIERRSRERGLIGQNSSARRETWRPWSNHHHNRELARSSTATNEVSRSCRDRRLMQICGHTPRFEAGPNQRVCHPK
jgi:hypothetical protein